MTIDLPGNGQQAYAWGARASLADGIAAIVSALAAEDEPVVLVGHSLGGMSISGAAEILPERIAKLVYLSALLPLDRQSANDIGRAIPLASNDASIILDDGDWIDVDPVKARHSLYNDCGDELATGRSRGGDRPTWTMSPDLLN